MKGTERKSCEDCQNALSVDRGYSNYTVEGTEFHCMANLHPDAPFDRWYGEEEKLLYAKQCDGFISGEAIGIDVEWRAIEGLSPEQLSRLRKFQDSGALG